MPAPNLNPRRSWAFFGPFSTFGPIWGPPKKLEILKIVLSVKQNVVTTYVTQFFTKKHKKCRFEANKVRFLLIFI